MKKAFTIIEMLVVVVVIATLMTIVFRLSSIGEDSEYHNRTIVRMQKLENCLSGYYAFGILEPACGSFQGHHLQRPCQGVRCRL